jgi:hypothetical protein
LETTSEIGQNSPKNILDYPAIDLAYEISLKTYEWTLQRIIACDNNLEKIFIWGITLTISITTLMVGGLINHDKILTFNSQWFIASIISFVIAIISASIGRLGILIISTKLKRFLHSEAKIWDPQLFIEDQQHWGTLKKNEFKKYFIIFAGEDFKNNVAYIKAKIIITTITSFLFLINIFFLLLWASS